MKEKLLGLLIVVLLLTIVFSGCLTNNSENNFNDGITVEQIKEKVLETTGNITFYKYLYYLNTTQEKTKNQTGEIITGLQSTMIKTGNVDKQNKELKAEEKEKDYCHIEGADYIETNTSCFRWEDNKTYYYINNETFYEKTEADNNITWKTYEVKNDSSRFISDNTDTWLQFSQLERQVFFFFNVTWANIILLPDEMIDGTECFVLSVTNIPNYIREYKTIKYWISKDDYSLKKAYLKQTFEDTILFETNDSLDTIWEEDIIFYDYNIPVNIELPEDGLS
jgi:hypothetical protein